MRELWDEYEQLLQENGVSISATKTAILNAILPPVPRPRGGLSFMLVNQNHQASIPAYDSEDSDQPSESFEDEIVIVPLPVSEKDLLDSKRKLKTIMDLKDMCRERNIPVSKCNKDGLKRKLLQYDYKGFVPPKVKKRKQIEYYNFAPEKNGSLMSQLYENLKVLEKDLREEEKEESAKEIRALRPHVMRHLDQSFTYHIIRHANKSLFDIYFKNGINHWRGQHGLCARKMHCPQEGFLRTSSLVSPLEDIMEKICQLVNLTVFSVWIPSATISHLSK